MEWININDQEPVDTIRSFRGTTYLVTVECEGWKERRTMVMDFEETTVRNKLVKRWRWNNSLKSEHWKVTHYMPLPNPCEI